MLKIKGLSYGLFEQSIVSLLNFLIIVINSRLMSTDDFAKFVLVYSAISLVYLICSSLLSAPILVYLPTKFYGKASIYIKFLVFKNVFITILLSTVILWFMNIYIIKLSFLECTFSILFTIMWGQYEILRKLNYSRNTIKNIFISSTVLVLFFSISTIFCREFLTIKYSFLILFISYAMAVIVVTILQKIKKLMKDENVLVERKEIVKTHWAFAKWTLLGNMLYWICTQGFFIMISNFISNQQLGGMRTALNLLGLITILLVLFENIFTPKVSILYQQEGISILSKYIKKLQYKTLPLLVIIIVLVTVVAYFSFSLIFGENYEKYKYLTIIFGLYQLSLGLNRPSIVALRALNKTRHFFIGNLISTIITIVVGLSLTILFKELGASIAIALSGFAITIYFQKSFNKEVDRINNYI